jgi:hypothetical protein
MEAKVIPDVARKYNALLAPEIDFLRYPVADQALPGQGLEILDIRSEGHLVDFTEVDFQYIAIVAADLLDGMPAVIQLIGRETRHFLVILETNKGDGQVSFIASFCHEKLLFFG